MNLIKVGKLKGRPVSELLDGYSLITIQAFDRQVKRIIKIILTKSELISLFKSLEEYPELGVHIGNGCFKMGMVALKLDWLSQAKGKERVVVPG